MIRTIYNFDKKYLTRVTLFRSRWFTLYFHIFHMPDPGRDLHNHPWNWCWSMCLWGGYNEKLFAHFCDGSKIAYRVPRYAMIPRWFYGETYHTIAELSRKHVFTLFAHGRRVRTWGFWRAGKHVPWHEYLIDEGINTAEEIEALKARYGDE